MGYVRLGKTGLRISRIALGCMSYGDPPAPARICGPWMTWRRNRSSVRPSSWASPSGIPPTSTSTAPPRNSSAGRSSGTPAARRSSWRPRCTARCTTVPAAKGCPARRPRAGRRLAGPARDRRHRPLPDPPLRSRRSGRGDHGGPARHREGRQGPLPGRQQHARLAVRQAPARRRPAWLDPLCVDAEPVQPAPAPGCCSTPSSPPPSSERPSPITCRTRSQHWPCTSPTTRSRPLKRRTHPTDPPGSNQLPLRRPSAGTAEHHHQQPSGPLRCVLQLPQGVGVTSR